MSELALLMKEMGSDNTDNNKFQVEHILVIGISDSTERLVHRMVNCLQDWGRNSVESIRLLALSAALTGLLYGTARLVEAFRNDDKKDPE